MFVNPGGPGESGVGLVRGDPEGLDAWGDGRFDVVSWDPRGTHASAPVRCFRSEEAEERFWEGASIPTTKRASTRYRARTAELARRCGEVSGRLLPHISTADTARDLDHLRGLVGDRRAHLRRPLLRHLPRPDLREHVPAPGSGDGAGRHRRPGRVLKGAERVARNVFAADWSSTSSSRCARWPGGSAARSPAGAAPLPSGSTGCSRNCGGRRSLPRARVHRASSTTAICWSRSSRRCANPALWPQDAEDLNAALGGDGSALRPPPARRSPRRAPPERRPQPRSRAPTPPRAGARGTGRR